MTPQDVKSRVREITRILTEEIDRPGNVDTRYSALKRAERESLKLLDALSELAE